MSYVINLDILRKIIYSVVFKHSAASSLSVVLQPGLLCYPCPTVAPKFLLPPLTPVCIFLPIPFFTSLSYPTQAHLHSPNITASIPPLLVFNLLSLHLEYLFHFYLFYSPLYFYLSQFLLLLFCLAISFLPFLLFIPPRWQEDAMPGAERGSGSWGNGGENRICILQLS